MLHDPKPPRKLYRNPVIFAMELHDEMVRDHLSRRQLGERHGISSDRITQKLLVLDLPEEVLDRVVARGDHWDRPFVTERKLRVMRLGIDIQHDVAQIYGDDLK
jgi:hypothetical protein